MPSVGETRGEGVGTAEPDVLRRSTMTTAEGPPLITLRRGDITDRKSVV